MTLQGTSFIGAGRGQVGGGSSFAINPATGEKLEPAYCSPSTAEANQAAELAAAAFPAYSRTTGAKRAAFLRKIAENIEALGSTLVERMMAESALPEARVKGETGRTTGQLRLFAAMLEEGSWCEARIEHADAARQPIPKPDLRSCLRPLGPVVVFCASNFPLAFSVAGGDSVSALAAGCPLIVKAHSSHPGTAELVAGAVRAAVVSEGLPDGVFSLLYGSGKEIGQLLVQHPAIKAVGFTGSRAGGRALMDLAAARPEPIPVYAEMSSINPIFILQGALEERGDALVTALHGSVTLGVGQFCTNPGLIILPSGPPAEKFKSDLGKLMAGSAAGTMLNNAICQAYQAGTSTLSANPNVKVLGQAAPGGINTAAPAVFESTVAAFLKDEALSAEVFGPATLVLTADSPAEIFAVAEHLEGQLTASIHASSADAAVQAELSPILERRAGRLVFGGFPTGVEVCHSMVHGGPYPATSDGRSTSVGTQSIYRFTRLVSWQSFPDASLPAELQESNPLGIRRMVDGKYV